MKKYIFKLVKTMTLIIIVSLVAEKETQAQNTYLKIVPQNMEAISYPPGTKFAVLNEVGAVILSDENKPNVYDLEGKTTLVVSPYYKAGNDTILLQNGKVEIATRSAKYVPATNHKKTQGGYTSNGVSLITSDITNSKSIPGSKNALLKFSNGVTYSYFDGKVSAMQNDKAIEVRGNSVVYSGEGFLKISFRPKNGELWWVYEAL